MTDLQARLRGVYRIPITDGLGPAGGEEPDNPNEFVRTFETSPIQHEAADRLDALVSDNRQKDARIQELEGALARAAITIKRYRRAGLGDDVFHSDLCEADRAIDAALGRNAG